MTSRSGGARRRHLVLCACVMGGLAAAPGEALAEFILDDGLYQLHDHPDGGAAEPFYGLRLDELTDAGDIFTFSFDYDHPDVGVFMQLTGSTIHIYGVAFGGLIDDHAYDPDHSGLVEIDFFYNDVVRVTGDDDLIAYDPDEPNMGFIVFQGDTIDLFDHANAEGFTFRLGDEDDDGGHRGFDGTLPNGETVDGRISGWGWLEHGTQGEYISASDWLFTVDPTPVPGPSTALLATLGAMLFLMGQPRKR